MSAPVIATSDPFAVHMEAVARKCLGDPNPRLSSAAELRFGAHGSLSVDLERGVWMDHEANKGGGVMDFLAREKGLRGQDAIAWLRREVGAPFEDRATDKDPPPKAQLVATYDYIDENGEVLFQVCRFTPKTFRQRRPDPSSPGGWAWGVKGVRQVPYRYAEVLSAIARHDMVFLVEGEKDADNLAKEGLWATCNAMGAGKWSDELSALLTGATVCILPDNDDAGRAHAAQVAASLKGRAKSVRVLELHDLPPKGDVSDWLAMGGEGRDLAMMAAKAPEWTPEPPKSRFGAIRWCDLDAVQVRQDWLVSEMMFCGDIGMVYGASGSGKSFLVTHMGLSIARGVPFLGHDTRKGAVLYQAGEGGKGLVKRLRAYKQEHRITEDLPFILLPARVDLFSADGDTDAFIDECRAWQAVLSDPLALIVIDTFSTASPGANENASEDMSRLISAGEAINKATGAALMWVHHKNAAGDRERGHTSLRANIDTAIEVTKDPETNLRTARLAKLKDGEDGLKLGFELHPVTVGTYDDGKEITSCVVSPAQVVTEQASERNRPRLPSGQASFLRCLDDAILQLGGVMPPNAGPSPDTLGVEWRSFMTVYKAVRGVTHDDNAMRQALMRDGDALNAKGLIGRNNPWVWLTEAGVQALRRYAPWA
jgi:hypothetical protein